MKNPKKTPLGCYAVISLISLALIIAGIGIAVVIGKDLISNGIEIFNQIDSRDIASIIAFFIIGIIVFSISIELFKISIDGMFNKKNKGVWEEVEVFHSFGETFDALHSVGIFKAFNPRENQTNIFRLYVGYKIVKNNFRVILEAREVKSFKENYNSYAEGETRHKYTSGSKIVAENSVMSQVHDLLTVFFMEAFEYKTRFSFEDKDNSETFEKVNWDLIRDVYYNKVKTSRDWK